MKRYLIILALCGAAHAGDDDIWERLRENSRQTEITNRLDEIKRQQEEILQAQRNVRNEQMSEAAYRLGAAQGAAAELEAYLHPREAAKPREAAVETETDRLRRIRLSERDIAVCLQGQSK